MRVGITGSSGLIGAALLRHLEATGHRPVPIVRRTAAEGEIAWDPDGGRLEAADLADLDAVVHLAGAGIGDRRWSEEYKRTLLDSRVRGTTLLAERLAELGRDGPQVLLSGSAIGIYGDRGDEELDETSAPGAGFLADVCRAWEAATATAEEAGIRVAHLRTGIVLGRESATLKRLLPVFKLGIGGRFGNGRQWWSWIAIEDEIAAIEHLLTSEVRGPVNLTAPNPVRNAQFAQTLGEVLHRPSLLPIPSFGPRLLFGSELVDALLLEGQRVHPAVLAGDGFAFRHAELAPALRAELGR